jgi:replication initiation and membrane attachment protein DnaB
MPKTKKQTRKQLKRKMLKAFINENDSTQSMKDFIAGFSDEYEPYDDELYNMAQELVDEGKLILVTMTDPEGQKQSWLMPPGTIVGSSVNACADTQVI